MDITCTSPSRQQKFHASDNRKRTIIYTLFVGVVVDRPTTSLRISSSKGQAKSEWMLLQYFEMVLILNFAELGAATVTTSVNCWCVWCPVSDRFSITWYK